MDMKKDIREKLKYSQKYLKDLTEGKEYDQTSPITLEWIGRTNDDIKKYKRLLVSADIKVEVGKIYNGNIKIVHIGKVDDPFRRNMLFIFEKLSNGLTYVERFEFMEEFAIEYELEEIEGK